MKKVIISHLNDIDYNEDVIFLIWDDFSFDKTIKNIISIPNFIENNSEILREKYLLWIENVILDHENTKA